MASILGHGEVTEPSFPTVTAAFYHHVLTCPDAVALRDLSGSPQDWTYSQLARQVQTLALLLRSHGVGSGQRVPLVVKRGVDMVVGIWAILSCGAQYVPLDGSVVPDKTIRRVLEEARSSMVLCLSSTKHRITALYPEKCVVVIDETPSAQDPNEDSHLDLSTPDDGCYVIYTSGQFPLPHDGTAFSQSQGTTGQPKGVDITHRNVTNLVCSSPGNLAIAPGTSVGSVLNISFDMGKSPKQNAILKLTFSAAWEIFACLCNGGTLVLRGSDWEPTLQEVCHVDNSILPTLIFLDRCSHLHSYHPIQIPSHSISSD